MLAELAQQIEEVVRNFFAQRFIINSPESAADNARFVFLAILSGPGCGESLAPVTRIACLIATQPHIPLVRYARAKIHQPQTEIWASLPNAECTYRPPAPGVNAVLCRA